MSDSPATPSPGTPPPQAAVQAAFWDLCATIARLRAPDGCPWDRAQTLETIKPFTLEETCELLEAIDSGDDAAIVDELGDVLLQVVLDAQIGADEGRFDIVAVIEGLTAKMIRRHPHVFATAEAETPEDVKTNWERIKQTEKKRHRDSKLDGIPVELPGLARAARLQEKAAKVGYDFPLRDMLFAKLDEELQELKDELYESGTVPSSPITLDAEPVPDEPILDPGRRERAERELGDVLFVLANIARRWKLNPEEAIRKTNAKFQRRFRAIEQGLAAAGQSVETATLAEMEAQYQQEKAREKAAEHKRP